MSSNPAPAPKGAGANALKTPAGDGDSFRQSFDRESNQWRKDAAKSKAANQHNGAKQPESTKRPGAAQSHKQAETPADAAKSGKADAAKPAGKMAKDADEQPGEGVEQYDVTPVASLPQPAEVRQGVGARSADAAPAVQGVLAQLRGAGLSQNLTVAQTADPAASLVPAGIAAADLVALDAETVEPLSISSKLLPTGKAPTLAVASQLPAPDLLAGKLNKGFKLENWQLSGIEGAIAAQLDTPEESTKVPGMNLFSTLSMPGLGTDASGARLQVPVTVSFGQPQWASSIAERSAWLVSQSIDNAELQLDPPELGRVNVQIQVHNNDQASVTFTSANAGVRDALDQTTQRLRELLAEQGLDLVNVDVSDQRNPNEREAPEGDGEGGLLAGDLEAADGAAPAPLQTTLEWGVDHYV